MFGKALSTKWQANALSANPAPARAPAYSSNTALCRRCTGARSLHTATECQPRARIASSREGLHASEALHGFHENRHQTKCSKLGNGARRTWQKLGRSCRGRHQLRPLCPLALHRSASASLSQAGCPASSRSAQRRRMHLKRADGRECSGGRRAAAQERVERDWTAARAARACRLPKPCATVPAASP